jgi:hypothetical protein
MPFMLLSPGMLNIFFACVALTLDSTGPAGGLIDQYATACEEIAYAPHISLHMLS